MPSIRAADAKRTFGTVLDHVSRGEVYTVIRKGRPVALIVSIDYMSEEGQFGALAAYAVPEKNALEADAFARAMEAMLDTHLCKRHPSISDRRST
jgi:prevent-host-death family protein